jgi:hypothetical protein
MHFFAVLARKQSQNRRQLLRIARWRQAIAALKFEDHGSRFYRSGETIWPAEGGIRF